jgi:hypothetical protein
MTKVFPVASLANLDMRSKYTRRLRKTSFVVGQYFKMRRRYASREIVGMLRAWNVRVDDGVLRALRDAVVRVRHTGGCASRSEKEGRAECGEVAVGELGDSWSFVAAIWVRRDASSRRSSWEG